MLSSTMTSTGAEPLSLPLHYSSTGNILKLLPETYQKKRGSTSVLIKRSNHLTENEQNTRQLLDNLMAEHINWGKFGSVTGSALEEKTDLFRMRRNALSNQKINTFFKKLLQEIWKLVQM